MSSFDSFRKGDRVLHRDMGERGSVVAVGATVDVQYDRVGQRGQPWSGKYDRDWFRMRPDVLINESREND